MKARRLLLAAAVIAIGACYLPKRIILPPTSFSNTCWYECQTRFENCKFGMICAQRRDNCLLSCPGAREVSREEWIDAGYGEAPPYGY